MSTVCPYTPPALAEPLPENWSSEELITFNDDGAWTWYSDERVVVDAAGGKIIVSSDANKGGRSGDVDAVIYDVESGTMTKEILGSLEPDDHNNAALLVKGPGEYFAAWTGHAHTDCNTYMRPFSGGSWGGTTTFNWTTAGGFSPKCAWSTPAGNRTVTYNNVWNMSAEGKIYNFVRSVETSPNFLVSADDGATWTYGGRLTAQPLEGYVAGYYKYWGNGVDRIDFLATEAHPRDSNNSLYHGYIKAGKVHDSFGAVVDDNANDGTALNITDYTTMFQEGTELSGLTLNHLWNFDIMRYEDGTITTLWKARNNGAEGQDNPDHRTLFSRFDGTSWTSTYLVKSGPKMYADEQDYVGGAALDPDRPEVIYVSTPFDPRDDTTDYGVHEIWKGVTCDGGATFSWTPVTMNSTQDNFRPVVPQWDSEHTAVLWFRGSYQTAQLYDADVVGIVSQPE